MFNPFKSKPTYQFKEDVDFKLIPDIAAAKREDPHPWNLKFLDRLIKVHSVQIPDEGSYQVNIKADVMEGEPLTTKENNLLGELLIELVHRNMIARN